MKSSVFGLVLCAVLGAMAASAQAPAADHPYTPFMMSIVTPLQVPTSDFDVGGLRGQTGGPGRGRGRTGRRLGRAGAGRAAREGRGHEQPPLKWCGAASDTGHEETDRRGAVATAAAPAGATA